MMEKGVSSVGPKPFFSSRGQSMLETALVLPVLLILIAGMVEVGMYALSYMTFLDASREAARFGTSLDPELTSKYPLDMRPSQPSFPDVRPPAIGGTDPSMTLEELEILCREGESNNFYYELACLAFQNVPMDTFVPEEGDDIVITVIGVDNGQIKHRWPLASHAHPSDWAYHFRGVSDGDTNPGCTSAALGNCRCWSLYGIHSSQLGNDVITGRLRAAAPSTGFVVVEIFHSHHLLVSVFNIGDFIPDPIKTQVYTIFPVPAGEPE